MEKATTCLALVFVFATQSLHAEVRLANIFNDNMVLQQEKPIRVWGWADSGKTITVTLSEGKNLAAKFLPEAEPPQAAATVPV